MSIQFRDHGTPVFRPEDSEHLREVASKIQTLRTNARDNGRHHEHGLAEILADENLSDSGRQNSIAVLEEARTAQRRSGIAAENKIIDDKITELERRLDGYVGYSSDNIIAFRDAQDRAESIEDEDRATQIMARALRNNDRTLAHAVFRAAVENRWAEAQRLFANDNETIARLVDDITQLRNLRNQFGRVLAYA